MTAFSAQSMSRNCRSFGLRELARIWELVSCLAWRDLRVRYKQSMLGIAWAVVQPVLLMVVFTLILGPVVARTLPDGLPYGLFAFAGLVPWVFFSTALTQCTSSLVANRNLVTKLYFPREAFPLSCVAAALVDFLIGFIALAGLIAFYNVRGTSVFEWNASLLLLPALVLLEIFLVAGLGMVLAMGNLFYRDVRQILSVALQLGMFASAVVIPSPTGSSWLAQIVRCNPLIVIISGFRNCLLHGSPPDPLEFMYAACVSLIVLIAGYTAFRRASFRFAECI